MNTYTLAFVNSKGGCGKTTSVYSIAGAMSKRLKKNEKILVIDADKQKNLTFCFLGTDEDEGMYGEMPQNTLYDFLMGENENVISQTKWQSRANANPKYYGVDIMIADKRLADEENLRDVDIDDVRERFEKLVSENGYKYVLVDMPPSNKKLNRIIFGAMVKSAVIPFSSDLFSENGYGDIIEEIDECRDINPYIKVLGVFFSRFFEGCGVDEFVKQDMISNNINLFKTHIPMLTDIRETPMFHRPIHYYKIISKTKTAVDELTSEIIVRMR